MLFCGTEAIALASRSFSNGPEAINNICVCGHVKCIVGRFPLAPPIPGP